MQRMNDRNVEGEYQSLHHFVSDAPWDRRTINQKRLETMEPIRHDESGWYVLDDTGQPRKYWSDKEGTDGVGSQWLGCLGKIDDGLVFVSTHYVQGQSHWPVSSQLYWPEKAREKLDEADRTPRRDRSKIEMANDELKQVANRRESSERKVIVDSWYGGNSGFIKRIDKQDWTYVAAINASNKIFDNTVDNELRPDSSVHEGPDRAAQTYCKRLEACDYEPVQVKRADGSVDTVYAACFRRPKLKSHGYVERLVIQVDDPHQPDPDEARYLITNEEDLTAAEIVRVYAKRNWVEVFYREAKNQLGLDEAQVRSERSLLRHWVLVMLAYTIIQRLRIQSDPPGASPTWRQTLREVRQVTTLKFWLEWVPDHFRRFVNWLARQHQLEVQQLTLTPAG